MVAEIAHSHGLGESADGIHLATVFSGNSINCSSKLCDEKCWRSAPGHFALNPPGLFSLSVSCDEFKVHTKQVVESYIHLSQIKKTNNFEARQFEFTSHRLRLFAEIQNGLVLHFRFIGNFAWDTW